MSFDSVYRAGVARVWADDRASQENFAKIVSEVRNSKGIDFEKVNAFFIPNDEYLVKYFPPDVRSSEYGFYNDNGECFWNNCMVMPIYDVADNVRSVAGFNPFRYVQAKETGDKSLNYYLYAPNRTFKKGSFLFYTEGTYRHALEERYLFVVDGVFDAYALANEGFNAAALMGSSLTPEIIALLRFVKRVFLVADNDEAGMKLAIALRRVHPGVVLVKQKFTKDIDELLKSDRHDETVLALKRATQSYQQEFLI